MNNQEQQLQDQEQIPAQSFTLEPMFAPVGAKEPVQVKLGQVKTGLVPSRERLQIIDLLSTAKPREIHFRRVEREGA